MSYARAPSENALGETVEEIFFQALEQAADERDAFLDDTCRGNPHLRSEVASLLTALDEPEIFRDDAASELARQLDAEPATGADEASPLARPDRLGPYRLLGVLGRGGMGTVFLAEQEEPLRRRVAVKLMHWSGAGKRALRRFEFEREALARMSHPAIAQVFDAGTSEHGQPFVALEYIPGQPITEYCKDRRLCLRRRLEIFVAVCDGVRHAHEKAVLHRDLKPSNLLVSEVQGKATPKIIDFGIAKGLGSAGAFDEPKTHSQIRIGSPGYMSPEALAVGGPGVDTRSDIYSLGVVLCQLLVGTRPTARRSSSLLDPVETRPDDDLPRPSRLLAALGPNERQRIAAERRTTAPRLQRLLRGELDWIVMRAIAPEPEQRYPSVADLAADLERWLGGHPVAARPPSLAYRARKALRRHTAAATAAGLVLAMFLGFGVRAHDLYRETRAARVQAEELVSFMLDDLSTQLEPMGRLELLDAVSRQSLAYFESSTDGRLDLAGRHPAAALRQIGKVLSSRGDLEASLEASERALAIDRRRWREQPAALLPRLDLARDLQQLGHLHQTRGDMALAADGFIEAETHLRHLVESFPEHYPARLALAKNLASFQAPFYRTTGEIETARSLSERGLAMLRDLLELRPHHVDTRTTLGEALYSNGLLELFAFGNAEAAVLRFQEGIAVYRDLARSRPEASRWRYRLAVLLGHGLVTAHKYSGDLPRARAANREALEIYEVLIREDPRHGGWAHGFGWELTRRAELAHQAQELDTAARALDRSVEVQTDLLARSVDPPTAWLDGLAFAQEFLARIRAERGEILPALEAAEAGLLTRHRIHGGDAALPFYRMALASVSLRIGEIHLQIGDREAARGPVRAAAEILGRLGEEDLLDAIEPQELAEIRRRLEASRKRIFSAAYP